MSRGALFRFSNVEVNGLPARCQFGIARIEEFSSDFHPDGQKASESSKKLPVLEEDEDIVMEDAYGSTTTGKVVLNRANWLVKKVKPTKSVSKDRTDATKDVQLLNSVMYFSPNVAETRYVPIEGPWPQVLEMKIYWTRSRLDDHVAILDRNERLHPQVFLWGTVKKVIDNPSAYRWGKMRDKDGQWHYEVYGKIALRIQGADVRVAWKLNKGRKWGKLEGKIDAL